MNVFQCVSSVQCAFSEYVQAAYIMQSALGKIEKIQHSKCCKGNGLKTLVFYMTRLLLSEGKMVKESELHQQEEKE